MNEKAIQAIKQQLDYSFYEINDYIHILYQTGDMVTKNILLNHLWNRVAHLQLLNQLLIAQIEQPPATPQPTTPTLPPQLTPLPEPIVPPTTEPVLTRKELKTYDGKNGKPAYVAVNGRVYDVTNNAAWAAASHFGLMAGNDLSQQFQSCHPNQLNILNQLKVVGRLE